MLKRIIDGIVSILELGDHKHFLQSDILKAFSGNLTQHTRYSQSLPRQSQSQSQDILYAVPGLTSTASTSIAGSDKPKQSTVVGTKTRTITWKRGKTNCRDCKSDINQICETITDVYSIEPRIAQTDDVQTEIDPNTVAFLDCNRSTHHCNIWQTLPIKRILAFASAQLAISRLGMAKPR